MEVDIGGGGVGPPECGPRRSPPRTYGFTGYGRVVYPLPRGITWRGGAFL